MVSTLNKWMVEDYVGLLRDQESVVVFNLDQVNVEEAQNLRNAVREQGARFRVGKNRLVKVAFEEAGVPLQGDVLHGTCGLLIGDVESTIGAAKAIEELWKKAKPRKLSYCGAYFDGTVMDAKAAATIADMPDRQTLRAMICGAIQGPARKLAAVLAEVPASTARVVQARADQGEAA
ncbi:MAG: 50S ribosomal protein L10 [Planctomycetota bacterium]|nr:MAG: 50S ribosomal protein L10 [Planctomycetota bacterium]